MSLYVMIDNETMGLDLQAANYELHKRLNE
jgi:hypothetical protein